MTIWATRPVDAVPTIALARWSVFQTETGERHFVGYNTTEGEGRVSSTILFYDAATKCGTTKSGRVYQLVGDPGVNMDAMYVKGRWCNINNVMEEIDVTEEYV